jgi:hypothetical protein
MTQAEFEKAYFEAHGFPCWEQFLREGKQAGKTDRRIADEYSELSVKQLVAMGGRPNKARK